MTALGEPATLLDVWERAARVPDAARSAVLVHGAGLVGRLDEALDLDLGTCAALASRAYREDFGETAEAVAVCGACGELIEAVIPVGDLAAEVGPGAAAAGTEVGEWVVRALTTRDLLDAAAVEDGAALLLRRSVRSVRTGLPPDELTPDLDAAAEALAGQGSLVSVVGCPGCGSAVEVGLDVGALLWERVVAVGSALLADVAALASAFGWTESEVLVLSPARRRAYLSLATP